MLAEINTSHRSLLSDSVLRHFDEERPEDGVYTGKVLFSDRDQAGNISDRDLLYGIEGSEAMDATQRDFLNRFKVGLDDLRKVEAKLRAVQEKAASETDKNELIKLKNQAKLYQNQIDRVDKRVRQWEQNDSMRDLANRKRSFLQKYVQGKTTSEIVELIGDAESKIADLSRNLDQAIQQIETEKRIGTLKSDVLRALDAMEQANAEYKKVQSLESKIQKMKESKDAAREKHAQELAHAVEAQNLQRVFDVQQMQDIKQESKDRELANAYLQKDMFQRKYNALKASYEKKLLEAKQSAGHAAESQSLQRVFDVQQMIEQRDAQTEKMKELRSANSRRMAAQQDMYQKQIAEIRERHALGEERRKLQRRIKRQVTHLNDLIVHEDDYRHVPEGFKPAVRGLVEAFLGEDGRFVFGKRTSETGGGKKDA